MKTIAPHSVKNYICATYCKKLLIARAGRANVAPAVCRSLIRSLPVSPRVHTGQRRPTAGDRGGQAQHQSTQQQGEEAAVDRREMGGAWRGEVPAKVTFSLDVKGAEAGADGPR